jgi:membrane associated rhomboid family serine protease
MSGNYRPSGFSILPPVVKNLLIINGIFFLATVSLLYAQNIDLTDSLGLHYIGSEAFRPYQLVTYMFMHGDLSHLFFNMLAVWMFGSAIENVWGGKRFLVYYFITGFGAALIHYVLVYYEMRPMLDALNTYALNPDPETVQSLVNLCETSKADMEMRLKMQDFVNQYNQLLPEQAKAAEDLSIQFFLDYRQDFLNIPNIVGASGALFGILLAFGMLFPNMFIYVYFFIPIKAKYLVILYGIVELYSGLKNNPGDNVAHFAHLGGMLFGFILIMYWRKKGFDSTRFM